MFKELQLTNFKAFATPSSIPIRPITLIFGPNSSGKSSIFQSLLMLKQTVESENSEIVLSPKGGQHDGGSFRDFVHQHDVKRTVSFKLTALVGENEFASPDVRQFDWELAQEFTSVGLKPTFAFEKHVISLQSVELFLGDDPKPLARFVPALKAGANFRAFILDHLNREHLLWSHVWSKYLEPFVVNVLEAIESDLRKIDAEIQERFGTIENAKHEGAIRRDAIEARYAKLSSSEHRRMAGIDFTELEKTGDLTQAGCFLAEDYERIAGYRSALAAYSVETLFDDFDSAKQHQIITTRKFWPNLIRTLERGPTVATGYGSGVGVDLVAMTGLADAIKHSELDSELIGVLEHSDAAPEPSWLGNLICTFLPFGVAEVAREVIAGTLESLEYVGPLRPAPKRVYYSEGVRATSVGKEGDGFAELLLTNAEFVDRTNSYLAQMGIAYDLIVSRESDESEVFRIRLMDRKTQIESSIADVGFGISQILPILLQCGLTFERTICIEQPELHLHPAAQAALADVFIDSSLGNRENTFIIETHSEHLILRILKRIRQTTSGNLPDGLPKINPSDVQVVYAEPTEHGTLLHMLDITEEGDFATQWPAGFFTERAKELF